jgi:hypothetical protein
VRRLPLLAILCACGAASLPLHGAEPVVTAGKQRAASAAIEWDVHDIEHAVLGPIKYAVQKHAVTTSVAKAKIFSLSFVSCQKRNGKIAIELTNAADSDPAGGLAPSATPRLVCEGPPARGRSAGTKHDLAAKWEIRPLGDTLARDLEPAELRRCVAIDVVQSVALPPGSPRKSQRIEMTIPPYDRGLDAVFAACGERSVYAASAPAPAVPAPAPAPAAPHSPPVPAAKPVAPAPPPAPAAETAAQAPAPAAKAEGSWQRARTTPKGRTNLRAAPSTQAAIVAKLAPNSNLLVQPVGSSWWKVRTTRGSAVAGYVREDRLVLE